MRACRWIVAESGLARYLHSAVLLSGTVLVFGGNTHNDTSLSNGAKCFSADFMAYDIGEDANRVAILCRSPDPNFLLFFIVVVVLGDATGCEV